MPLRSPKLKTENGKLPDRSITPILRRSASGNFPAFAEMVGRKPTLGYNRGMFPGGDLLSSILRPPTEER